MFLCLVFLILLRLFIAGLCTCCERADLGAVVGDVYCICVTFPCGILLNCIVSLSLPPFLLYSFNAVFLE